MKKRFYVTLAACALAGILVLCGDDSSPTDPDNDPVITHPLAGTWLDTILAKPDAGLTKAVFFGLTLNLNAQTGDSSFLFFALEDPDKYLYKHSGKWQVTGSSLTCSGSACQIIDKNTGQLVTAPDSTANKVITIDTTGTGACAWGDKPITEYGDVWESLTVSSVFINWLKSNYLALKKKKAL